MESIWEKVKKTSKVSSLATHSLPPSYKLVDRYSGAGTGTGAGAGQDGGANHGGEELLGKEVAGVKDESAAQHAKDAQDTQDCYIVVEINDGWYSRLRSACLPWHLPVVFSFGTTMVQSMTTPPNSNGIVRMAFLPNLV